MGDAMRWLQRKGTLGSSAWGVAKTCKFGMPGADPHISHKAGATAFLSGDLDDGGG